MIIIAVYPVRIESKKYIKLFNFECILQFIQLGLKEGKVIGTVSGYTDCSLSS